MILYEGIFRRPRIKTNRLLYKHAPIFTGKVINVSGADDYDKDCSLKDYFTGNYDNGKIYKEYFSNADEYYISNYPGDLTRLDNNKNNLIDIDLEENISKEYIEYFDVVFNHTVLEHIFDVFKAFENLCKMSKDIVILIVPQFQKIHDLRRGYKDYWRFTPYSIEKLFFQNGYTILFREITGGFSESKYLYYIASKNPKKWEHYFPEIKTIENYLNFRNDGSLYTIISYLQLMFESVLRKILKIKPK